MAQSDLNIYSLILSGIQDSSKIASFPGYSLNTILLIIGLKSRIRQDIREDFEGQVRKTGAYSWFLFFKAYFGILPKFCKIAKPTTQNLE